MRAKTPNKARTTLDPQRIKAVETGTGISWDEWVSFFTPHQDFDHTSLAKLALDHIVEQGKSRSPEWWAQGATILFENYIGRRVQGERCDGTFGVSASKTVAATMDEALAAVVTVAGALEEFAGTPTLGSSRTSATDKWRYWKVDLADGSRVSINICAKGEGKASVAVDHDKLTSPDNRDAIKAWWRELLTQVAQAIVR